MAEIGMAPVERDGVLHRPMVHLVEPGQQAGAAGTAGHRLGEVVAKGDAGFAQRVDVGRAQHARPGSGRAKLGEEVAAPLVDDDEQHVLALRQRGSLPQDSDDGAP
jgi:hypothetical protein